MLSPKNLPPRTYTRASPLRIIVGGFLGLFPAGGVTWDYLQYPLGFAGLGHDVFYIEDTCLWPVFQKNDLSLEGCQHNVEHLQRVMNSFGMHDRWAYRDIASGKTFGMPKNKIDEVTSTADVFVNVSCASVIRDEFQQIPVRILIDSDPMFTQIQLLTRKGLTTPDSQINQLVDWHTHHFTFGENIGANDCRIPFAGIRWLPTRQPICLDQWNATSLPDRKDPGYTTVMNWSAGPAQEYAGEYWGQKDLEWVHIQGLPRILPSTRFSVAVAQTCGQPFPKSAVEESGWRVLDPTQCVPDWESYRTFIQKSRGETSIAKNTYVKARTGWFSCRSACYLASGRPVVAQNTGWTKFIPEGEGLFAFEDTAGAIDAIRQIESAPERHANAARRIAEEYFSSDRVLSSLLGQVGFN